MTATYLTLTGHRIPVTEAQRLSVPLEWLRFPIGAPYALGFLGLLVGLAVPAVGIVAAAGFVVFFVLAIGAHLRVGDRSLGRAAGGLSLSLATLVATGMYAAEQDDPSTGSGHRFGRNLALNATLSLVLCVAVLVFCFLR